MLEPASTTRFGRKKRRKAKAIDEIAFQSASELETRIFFLPRGPKERNEKAFAHAECVVLHFKDEVTYCRQHTVSEEFVCNSGSSPRGYEASSRIRRSNEISLPLNFCTGFQTRRRISHVSPHFMWTGERTLNVMERKRDLEHFVMCLLSSGAAARDQLLLKLKKGGQSGDWNALLKILAQHSNEDHEVARQFLRT